MFLNESVQDCLENECQHKGLHLSGQTLYNDTVECFGFSSKKPQEKEWSTDRHLHPGEKHQDCRGNCLEICVWFWRSFVSFGRQPLLTDISVEHLLTLPCCPEENSGQLHPQYRPVHVFAASEESSDGLDGVIGDSTLGCAHEANLTHPGSVGLVEGHYEEPTHDEHKVPPVFGELDKLFSEWLLF